MHLFKEVTVTQNETVSSAFTLPEHMEAIGANIPNIDAGNVGLEVTFDGGSNWVPVLELGSDAVILASGADPGYAQFEHLVKSVPNFSNSQLRFTMASQTTAGVTIGLTVKMRSKVR